MLSCGRNVLRDSDMMAATLGEEIDPGPGHSDLKRGDLVFWRGHVAIVEGDGNLLHANGYTMDVTSEPMDQALERIATLFEEPIGYRRPWIGN
jgi:cell wall-associated NlpC family hydrolase